jgi:DNA-directed RNA polymerase specialized sigma24 family protein
VTNSAFHPTRWTLVLRARGQGDEARTALSDLCSAYYAPIVAFLRREGRDDDAAREMAHAFFAVLLQGGVGSPDRERGRFRSYLLGALKHFLANHRDATRTAKRGAGAEHVPLGTGTDTDASAGFSLPSAWDDTLVFDREWAHTLIARALAALETEHSAKPDLLAALMPWLDGGANLAQADAARHLGLSETAVKVAIHRLRQRFRELIRAEVAATVNDPADLNDELKHLISIVSSGA